MSKWMLFVDGENLTIQGQRVAESNSIALNEGELCKKDVFSWIPFYHEFNPSNLQMFHNEYVAHVPIRSSYYTSLVGDENSIKEVKTKLRSLGFNPEVFKKESKSQKAQGVDISLTKDICYCMHSLTTTILPF